MSSIFRISNSNGYLDKTGAAVSWLCAVHCLAMPFAVSSLPILGLGFLVREEFEFVFIVLSASIASLSLLPAFFKLHRKINTLVLFVIGFGFIVFSDSLFEEYFIGRAIFLVTGAAFISFSHLLNRRLCRKCINCEIV